LKILVLTQTETRDRIFDGLVAVNLNQMGHKATVMNYVADGRRGVIRHKPDAVVMPEARCDFAVDFAEDVTRMGVLVIVRRCEPGFADVERWDASLRKIALSPMHYQHCVDLELVWADVFAKILVEEGYMPKEKLEAIGAPFATLYGNWPKEYFKSRNGFDKIYGLDPNKKTVCFATAWAMADRDPEYSIPEAPMGNSAHKKWYDICVEGRAKWIDGIRLLYNEYKDDWNFLIKQHPSETTIAYHKAFGVPLSPILATMANMNIVKRSDIKVLTGETAANAIKNSELLIHAGSTMAVEAHLAGVPAIQFCDMNDPGCLISKVSPYYELLPPNLFDTVELGKSNASPEAIAEIEEKLYGSLDGNAHSRVAVAIDKLKPRQTNIPNTWPHSTKSYETPGINKTIEWSMNRINVSQCPGCKNLCYPESWRTLFKCPNCALMITKRL